MKITGGKVFDLERGFVERDVCFDGALLTPDSRDGETCDASGCWVIPGLTDVHFHGCRGRTCPTATRTDCRPWRSTSGAGA